MCSLIDCRSPAVATSLLASMDERVPVENGNDITNELCHALLRHLSGNSKEAILEVSRSFIGVTERLEQELKSIFNVKDLEVHFLVAIPHSAPSCQ